ncbi:MAG TPA: hypothetical protein VK489_16540 [Ferruginibacter sp.]|nr:hypothetical protein [Ferruginibacter sp.]
MKIEHLLVQHFYNNKEVTLQGMGTFKLSPDFVMPMETDKDAVMPENAISFQYNSRATEDDALINFIVQQTHKIKPLASADLDSYLALGKQFLNIGKPFMIEGLGLLEKNQLGEYQFSQGNVVSAKPEASATVKDKSEDADISFASERKASPVNKKAIWIVVAIIGIGMVAAAAWYFLTPKKETTEKIADIPVITQDTTTAVLPDTTVKKTDSIATVTAPVSPGDDYSFKVVIKNYPSRQLAEKAYNRLTSYGHKLLMYTADSITYKVAMPFTRPLADTAVTKDSIRTKLFGGNPYIELK